MDWVQFLDGYDRWPPLQSRLKLVRAQIADALSAQPSGHIRLLSLCAGDGRDVIGVLVDHPRRADVVATLVELHPDLVARGDDAIEHFVLSSSVRFLCADATRADIYLPITPADMVVLAGVLGNVQPASEQRLIDSLRALCRPGGLVIWTRGVGDLTGERAAARICGHLAAAGFREIARAYSEPHGFVIVTHAFEGTPSALLPGAMLFEFTDYDQIQE